MAERRYPAYNPDVLGRASTFNPARASMPVMPSTMGMGYNPVYPGDIHSYPTGPSRHDNGPIRYHHSTAPHPRGQGSPVYAATDDAPPRTSRLPRDVVPTTARTRRSSTIDSAGHRPIIITTTGTNARPPGHNSAARGRSRSPARDEYRPVGASIRAPRRQSRSGSMSRQPLAPPYSPMFASEDEYSSRIRGPEVVPAAGRADAYRTSRPTVLYPSNPRHTTVDIGDQYGYTKPGDLVQYDLEHPKHTRHRRHDSFDHYARPNVYYNPERRGFNIETHRTHDSTAGAAPRSSETRGGPPPTTWGLDRLNRNSAMYEPVSVPPAAPVPPPAAHHPDLTLATPRERRGSNRHARPVSLYQEAPPRPSRDNVTQWPRGDERPSRKERDHDQGVYVDELVSDRGFGIRTDLIPEPNDRRDRRERARKEYADSARLPANDLDHDWDRIEHVEARELDDGKEQRRRPPRVVNDEEEGGAARDRDAEPEPRRRLKDNLKAGLGIAASAVGLGPVVNKDGKSEGGEDGEASRERLDKDRKGKERYRKDLEGEDRDRKGKERYRKEFEDEAAPVFSSDDEDEVEIISARASDRYRPGEKAYISRDHQDRDRGRERDRMGPIDPSLGDAAPRSRSRSHSRHSQDVEGAASDGKPTKKSSRDVSRSDDGDADNTRKGSRRPSFNPNDKEDLDDIKEKLASMSVHDKKDQDGERVMVVDPRSDSATRSERPEPSASSRRDPVDQARDIINSASERKAVRVVSPPPHDREGPDAKPKKGILKAPRPKFPEDPNPMREGVAPHKNDEKLKEVPPGARWTRISRKIVNPDALEVGKERYEVRDDFVIVLRVLSREEIEAYAAATAVLRERKRRDLDRSKQGSDEEEEDDEDDRRRRRRRYRVREDPEDEERKGENDRRGRYRRHRRHDEEQEYGDEGELKRHEHHHHRRHREREGGS
ncbi:uncharacterized protein DNG_02677 [Cephalotrichum gorgonifer]|uniref:DUF8035 domain-containing protein n=1 Tax=Cephalotrichum gorgonifer TaxID=2041049 RepID=A0AAE8MTF9_9PEZI|nr:uncharacterized protein DNG_02677 [Cephalotrichum gorgonifer]